jgi:hypothetical protein
MNEKRLFLLALLLVTAVASLPAQLVNGRFTTSFYSWEQYDTVGVSKAYLRAYQTVQLSVAQGDFVFHTFAQGVMNGANSFGDVGRVRFYNLYATWTGFSRTLDLSLGRQAVFAGVGNGNIDGLTARARLLDDKITVTGYGGSTVKEEYTGVRSDWHDNINVGGQVVTTLVPDARIGLSYMNRREEYDPYWTTRARDSLGIPVPYYISGTSLARQLGSVDASYLCGDLLTAYGRYDYDFNFSETSRGEGGVRVHVMPMLDVTGDVFYRKPQIAYNSIFSAFAASSTTEIEGGVEYIVTPMVRVFGKLGSVSYTDDNSMRWTLGVNGGYGSVTYTGSSGFAGELTSFNAEGTYPFFDRTLLPSLGVSLVSYRLSADSPRDNALAVLLGATVRPLRSFSFDVQGQWMRNRLYDHDMRLQVRLLYWFAERLSLFSEEAH